MPVQIDARPAVSILFALIRSLLRGAATVGGYAFLCSFAVAGAPSSAHFFCRSSRSGATASVLAVLLAVPTHAALGPISVGYQCVEPSRGNASAAFRMDDLCGLTPPAVVVRGSRIRAESANHRLGNFVAAESTFIPRESVHALIWRAPWLLQGAALQRLRDIASLILAPPHRFCSGRYARIWG
jgi:hypothetical protein